MHILLLLHIHFLLKKFISNLSIGVIPTETPAKSYISLLWAFSVGSWFCDQLHQQKLLKKLDAYKVFEYCSSRKLKEF
jgi:hypothetical protein